jgi:hypothetical protein
MAFLKVDSPTLLFHHHLSGFNCGFVCIAEMTSEKVTNFFEKIDFLGWIMGEWKCLTRSKCMSECGSEKLGCRTGLPWPYNEKGRIGSRYSLFLNTFIQIG